MTEGPLGRCHQWEGGRTVSERRRRREEPVRLSVFQTHRAISGQAP